MSDRFFGFSSAIQAVISANIPNDKSRDAALEDVAHILEKITSKPLFKPMYLPALVYQATFSVASQFHNTPSEYIRNSFQFQPKRSIAGLFEITHFLIPFMEHLTEKQHVQLLRVHFNPSFLTILRDRLKFITDAPEYLLFKLQQFRKALIQTSFALGMTRLFNRPLEK